MYDFSWHEIHSTKTKIAAEATLSILQDIFGPRNILDVGCGSGIWLWKANKLGFSDFIGVDGPWTNSKNLVIAERNFTKIDLENKFDLSRRFDVAISLEVAEHIDRKYSNVMVENLARHSDVLLFGAAIPYQGGYRHINEMWQSWWANKFSERGYQYFDVIRPQIWHNENIDFWYKQNSLVYVNRNRPDLVSRFTDYVTTKNLSQFPLDIVHPDKYEATASYKQIAFKPLARELPTAVLNKIMSVILRKI